MIITSTMNLDQLEERMGDNATEAQAERMRELLVEFALHVPGVTVTQDLTESQWIELIEKAAQE
jgi:hypothetical protein